ncbi:MAG: MerR family transcriptional regulator [Ilumatobacter sp.]|uniref:transcriptional regulator FtsR n=1 Tax=Ilumatobacter sp. TaxID=1967498 RepID=UPI003C741A72
MGEEPATATSQATPGSHLSIGEVLALLLEDFPDVTISKIRFLESQGLIQPERTASGYRKFYDDDVELLRCVLREQKDNFLPLKVIKDRLDTGEIDPTNELQRPRGITSLGDETGDIPVDGSLGVSRHPASSGARAASNEPARPTPTAVPAADDTGSIALAPGVVLDAAEVCSMSGLSPEQLAQVESYGVVVPAANGSYDEDGLEVARIAKRFLDLGVDARHLRGWRVAADREAGLFEQVIQPLIRQRNPQSSDHAVAQLNELAMFGGQLRAAMMRTLLRAHLDR